MVKSKTSPNIILAAIDSRATGETYPVVATVPWKEGVENDNLYIFQDTTKLNPTFLIGSNEQLDINPRSKSFTLEAVKIGVSTGEKTYADLNITQEKATYEYTLEIKSKSGEITIPASGGSLELKGILTTWRNGRKVSTLETPFTMSGYAPGFSISGKTVTASNRGTVIGPSRAINIVGYTNNTIDGSTISGSVIITQEENKVTKVAPSVTLSYNPSEIPAKGGTSSPVVGNISYITTFSSGETLNDLPTSEYINTITKTNTFKIHTSNSPFSIDESTGVVTIGTRGTILGEALEETIYLTHRVQISYKDNIFEPTSNSITRTADITQQANTVTYSDINISLFGAADIPASGGQVSSGTVSYSQVASYTSGEFENITTGATITYGDPVSANSKDITISNSTVAGTLEVTVSLNGKTATKTVDVYQEQNKVTQIELLDSWAHNYSIEGTAAQNSVGPDLMSRTYNVKYTFLSGATSTDKPGTEFGTLSDTVSYSWPGPGGSFTGLSAQSGNVTMRSLGTSIVNETTSPQVTRTDKVTWTPSSNYGYKTLESNEIQKQAQVTREGNYVVDIQLPEAVLSLSYNPSEIPAKGGSSSPTVTQSKEPSMIYTSGVQGEPGVIPASTYGSFYTDSNYELGTINSQYSTWKINAITGVLTVTSNKTSRVDRGSAESKYHKNFRWVPSSVYNGGGADITRHATATVYQQANTIESEEIIIDSFVYNTDIPVLGGNSSPSLSIHINQLYTSEEVKRVNPDSYTSKYAFVGTAPSTFSINANTGVVSATEAEVSQELKANVKVDVSSPSWNGSSTLTKSAQADVAQPAGTVIYDTPVITISYPQVPAKGGTVSPTIQVTQAWGWNDDYDEGVNTFNLNTLPAGSYSFTNATSPTNGNVTLASKGTTVSGVTVGKTVTFTVTLNGKSANKQANVNQQANSIDSVAVTFGWHNNTNSVAASGGNLVVDVSVKNTYTSTSTNTVYPSATDAGISLTVSGVSGATVSKATITVPNRGSTVGPALTGTVTGNYNGTNSGNSLTFTQAENRVTKLEAGVSDPNTSTVHFWYTGQPIPASGGTATVVGNGKGVLTFSSGSVVTETTWSGQSKYGGTLSAGRTFSMTNGNGFTINTTNGSVTAANRGTTVGAVRTSNVITSELTLTFTHPASMGSTKVNGSIRGTQTVSQQANQIKAYGNPTGGSLTVNDIPAKGGTISSGTIGGTVSQTRTYTSGSNDTYSQATPTNGSYSAGISGSNLGTTVTSRTSKGTLTYTYTLNGKSGSISATVYQQANTWKDNRMTLSASSTSIGAGGGTVTLHTVVYRMYTSGTEGLGGNDMVTSWSGSATGFTLSGFNLTAANRGTTVGAARSITLTATYAHLTSNSVTVTQAANSLTWNNPVITFSYPGDIPASGGTITPTVSITQSGSYSSGSPASNTTIASKSFSGTGVNASTGAYTASSLGTTVKPRTNLVTATVTVTANGKTGTKSADVYQQANTWKDNRMTLSASSTSIGAGGGTVTLHTVVYRMYTSGTEGLGGNDMVTSWSGSATGFTLSGFNLTAANRGTTVGAARSITLTATYAHLTSNSVTVTQAANSLTWNNPVITFSYPGDIPASGGTITPTVSITQSGSYSSGSPASNTTIASKSFSGTGVNASTGAYTASSLGTTVKPRTNLVTATVTVTANGKTGTKSADVYQAQNRLLNGDLNGSNSDFKATCTLLANQLTAAGGTATFGGSASHTHRYYTQYDSGTYGPYTKTVTDGISLSMVGNGNSRFSFANSVATHSNMGKNVTTDTVTIRCTNSANTSTHHDASASISNAVGAWVDTGITAYGTPSVSIGSGLTAAGGSATVSHSVSNTMGQKRTYTSGSYDTQSVSRAGTTTIAITTNGNSRFSLSGNTLSHSNMTSNVTTDTVVITAKNSGDTSKTKTATQSISNAVGAWVDTGITAYGTPSVSIGSGLTAAGGSATVSHSVSNTMGQKRTYTSGSYDTQSVSRAGTTTIAITTNGNSRFSLSGNTLSHSNMTSNVTTDTVVITAKNSGDTSKTKTATQSISNAVTGYNAPTIGAFTYPAGSISYSGGSQSPSYSIYQNLTYTSGTSALTRVDDNWYGGNNYSKGFSITGTGFSINYSTGVVTAASNSSTSTRSATVTMSINGRTSVILDKATATVTQAAKPGPQRVDISINDPMLAGGEVVLTFSPACYDNITVLVMGYTQDGSIFSEYRQVGGGILQDRFYPSGGGYANSASIENIDGESIPPVTKSNGIYYW